MSLWLELRMEAECESVSQSESRFSQLSAIVFHTPHICRAPSPILSGICSSRGGVNRRRTFLMYRVIYYDISIIITTLAFSGPFSGAMHFLSEINE